MTIDPDNLAILRDEESEPDFSAIIKKAKDRIAGIDFDDPRVTFELETIRDLLAVIEHYDNELAAQHYHMSDNGQLPAGA